MEKRYRAAASHVDRHALEQAAGDVYRSDTCCRLLRWSRAANRNRLAKRRTLVFINRPIYGCGSSPRRVRQTLLSLAANLPPVQAPALRDVNKDRGNQCQTKTLD